MSIYACSHLASGGVYVLCKKSWNKNPVDLQFKNQKLKGAKCLLGQLKQAVGVPLVDRSTQGDALVEPAAFHPLRMLSLWLLIHCWHRWRRRHDGPGNGKHGGKRENKDKKQDKKNKNAIKEKKKTRFAPAWRQLAAEDPELEAVPLATVTSNGLCVDAIWVFNKSTLACSSWIVSLCTISSGTKLKISVASLDDHGV